MTFQPVIPFGGPAGWAFLNRTIERQREAMANSAPVQRDETYFAEKIPDVSTASDLVSDRRLLNVALKAFGLENDLSNKFFVQQVLESRSLEEGSLANRLSDKRYLALNKAFGFGDFSTPRTRLSDFPEEILTRFREKTFANSVGEQDPNLRLALEFKAEIGRIVEGETNQDLIWYKVLGSRPLRQVVEVALGLPQGIGAGNIDQQLRLYKARLNTVFGSEQLSQFVDPDNAERMIQHFLARSQIGSLPGSLGSQSVALKLLQNSA